jgi:hypothetical protein
MKLAILAALIFAAGLWPGIAKSTGPLPDARRAQSVAVVEHHPVLVKMAGVFKLRF